MTAPGSNPSIDGRCIDRQPVAANPDPAPTYHYVVVREDLSHGMQAAQVGHAVGDSCAARHPTGTRMVVLGVPDESTLHRIAQALAKQGVEPVVVTETEGAHAGQAMSLGVPPTTDRAAVRRAVSALPLVK